MAGDKLHRSGSHQPATVRSSGVTAIQSSMRVGRTLQPGKKVTLGFAQLRGPETKSALLDRAECLFATHGFNATSVRAITTAARANLGAVNYHFGSKNDLIVAVLRRRIRPLNEERIAMLEQFESNSKARPVSIGRILEALF